MKYKQIYLDNSENIIKFLKIFLSFLVAILIAYLPNYNLPVNAINTLFILLVATFLWISEAVQPFAVSFLIIALEIVLLGSSNNWHDWKIYLQPWAESIIFLFIGGFIIASASSKVGLDKFIANRTLKFVGNKLDNVISAILFLTFIMSMFVSNIATAVIMLTLVSPIIIFVSKNGAKAILLAIVIGANIGGIGTIIGSPPNAIAVGILGNQAPSFLDWILIALPPAILLAIILRVYLYFAYPSNGEKVLNLNLEDNEISNSKYKKIYITTIFIITVLLWLTASIHQIPTSVIAFFPIVAFTLAGILTSDDINSLRWDIIILLVGGLSLGFAITNSGLDKWIAQILTIGNVSPLVTTLIAVYTIAIVSNFMSNTAATNILLPLVIATTSSADIQISAITVAIGASFAMSLPISTPPNAIIFGTGKIEIKDFLKLGTITLIIGPVIFLSWIYFIK
jgi:sodium-dependent dicarboxylate transporter 2/3/5